MNINGTSLLMPSQICLYLEPLRIALLGQSHLIVNGTEVVNHPQIPRCHKSPPRSLPKYCSKNTTPPPTYRINYYVASTRF